MKNVTFTTDAALPSPTSLTIAHFGPSSSKVTRTITQSPPTKRVDGAYPSVNKTLMLLERLEVTPSIQTTKNIEERFLKIDEEVRAHCHGSAGTPLRTHAIGQDSGLEESRKTICT
jgi:hypothetical protein